MSASRRAPRAAFLVASLLIAALGTGCLLYYAAADPLSDVPPAAECTASQKVCVGKCYEQTDPSVGCSGQCSACDLPSNGQARCVLQDASEVCGFGTCDNEFGDCNHDAGDGCETPTTQSPNCGGCGVTCPKYCSPITYTCTDFCDASFCGSACDPDSGTNCLCVNTNTDSLNCGGCSNVCNLVPNATRYCDAGTCEWSCSDPSKCINNNHTKCVSADGFNASPNCGVCGVTCSGGTKCCPHNGGYACIQQFSGPADAAVGTGGSGVNGGSCNP